MLRRSASRLIFAALLSLAASSMPATAAPRPQASKSAPAAAKPAAEGTEQKPQARFDIDEFRIEGADTLPLIELEEAVYPFLGPDRSAEDVEKARAALEKAYHSKGYQAVGVAIPQQNPDRGFVVLKVTESKVGQLRVKGSRFFSLDKVKQSAPSLAEGKVPNFNDVTKDIVALNQWADRRVTPALRAGVTPGTVDVDLNVEDKPPLHASVELNNRQSANTKPLRVSSTVRYDNLWQLGHSLSFSYQVAPERPDDATVISASYLARVPGNDFLNLMFYGLKSDSSVATVGNLNVVGPGQVIGARGILTLPSRENFFHTVSAGVDYKDFKQSVSLGSDEFSSPITYYPIVANYGATFQGTLKDYESVTQLNAGVTNSLRGLGSTPLEFDTKRFKATGSFIYFRGDVSHTQELPGGGQLFGKVQGQIADQPLVSSEQFSGGGLDTVRGYLESEVVGDNGAAGTFELRTANIGALLQEAFKDQSADAPKITVFNDWRFFAFADGARVTVLEPLPEQQSRFDLASYGVGTRLRMFDYANGMVALAVPVISQTETRANKARVLFRVWGEF